MNKDTQLGYCCINIQLRDRGIMTNRTCRKKTFKEKGLSHISSLALQNVKNLLDIVTWNEMNDIHVYRMSSSLFPWMSEYELSDLPDYNKIKIVLSNIGHIVHQFNQRVSFHPGPFNVLGSPNESVVQKTIKELNQHAEIMDLMGLPKNHRFPINIHCNGTYGDKSATLNRWCNNFLRLSDSARKRLVVENDDKASMYSVKDLYHGIYEKVNVPVTFDYHHHRFNTGGLTEEAAFNLAYSTWNTKPLFHYSSAKKTFEDSSVKAQAHADYVYEQINDYGKNVDIELEVKAKEKALLTYKEVNHKLLTEYKTLI